MNLRKNHPKPVASRGMARFYDLVKALGSNTLFPEGLTVPILLEAIGMAHPHPNEWCKIGV
jgi:hypothetical protein